MAPDPAFLIGWAPTPPCVPWFVPRLPTRDGSGAPCVLQLWILPPCKGGLQCATCPTALDLASLQGRAPVHHVSYSTGSCLHVGDDSRAPCVLRLQILPTYREGSGAATTCPVVSCGPRALNIKKSLAGLPVQLDLYVSSAHVHVSKAPDVRAIMGMQDMWTGGYSVATVQRQPC
jgi:hypothetical protein